MNILDLAVSLLLFVQLDKKRLQGRSELHVEIEEIDDK